ncbi:MAG: hypothetical protein K5873_01560 [Treponema sp.]|nr:hypothetical protein [Treponema sp.]
MTDTVLCIDIGTSSLKAALLPDNLKKFPLFVSSQPFPKSSFEEKTSASYYLPALKKALEEIKKANPDYAIEAICISGNGPTVISDSGKTLLHDEKPSDESLLKNIVLPKDSHSLFIPRFALFKALYPQIWEDSPHIFGAPEFLIHELTGRALSILPSESFRPAYWSQNELFDWGFSESDIKKIPDFVKMGSFAGKVSEKAALETGLFEGTFVFAGSPDFVAALIGTGTVFPGRLCDRAGSSEGLNLCTTKPVFARGLRTLPGVIEGLWNLSYLITNEDLKDGSALELKKGIELLKSAAEREGEYFPDYMTITGGQALDEKLIAEKERACGIKIKKMPLAHAELLGDLILARVALGDFDDIEEAVFGLLGA